MSGKDKAAGRVLLPDAVLPSRYDLRLQPDLETFVYDGNVRITVEVHEATEEVSLHARELQVKSAKFTATAGGATIDLVSYEQDLKYNVLKLTFEEMLPVGAGTLEIEFIGHINDKLAGFYRSPYKDINGEKKMMASTQFESLDARRCFPCWDEPARKAVFAVTLVIDPSLTAFSNMPEKSSQLIKKAGSSTKHVKELVFMDSPKMSTYLLAFVVGEFDFVQTLSDHGVMIRTYTPPGRSTFGTFAMDVAKKCLDTYDDFFGLPYPLPKLDMVAIPEFSFGAMENWGLVTYREVDMLIDPKTASNTQKQRVAFVVAHELAHQWFGNLVTMNWWDDLWLNEGFATWCMTFASDLCMPSYEMWDQFLLDMTKLALSLDCLKTSHPIQVPIKHAEEVQDVFDNISYRKGACVIHVAHEVLGHEAFQKGLQIYMQRHQYSNTETYDLWNAWGEASGLPVAEMMGTWTEQMGHPLLDVKDCKISGGTAKLVVEQSWFLASGEAPPDDRTWCLPIFVETAKEKKMILMKERSMEIDVAMAEGSEADAYILLNAHMRVPMRVRYTHDMQQRLLKALANSRLSDCRDRAMLVMDGEALSQAGKIGVDDLLRLIASFAGETHYVVMETLAATLGELRIAFMGGAPDQVYSNFMKFASKWVMKAWDKLNLGFTVADSDGHLTGLLRGLMMQLVSTYAVGPDFLAEVTQRFNKWLEDPAAHAAELPDEFRVPLLKVMLSEGGKDVYAKLMAIWPKLHTNVVEKHVLLSIGSSNETSLKEAALKWAISGAVKKQDFFYVFKSTSESSKEGLDLTWSFIQREWSGIQSFVKGANPKIFDSLIQQSFAGHCTKQTADEIEKFFQKNPLPQNQRAISQAVEKTRNRAEFLSKALETEVVKQEFWDGLIGMI